MRWCAESTRTARAGVGSAVEAILLVALLTSCGGSTPTPGSSAPVRSDFLTIEYRPGRTADVYLADSNGRVPLVVLVPGGGWATADPAGLAGLAAALASAGIAAAPTHIRAAEDGVVYPTPVEDVICSVATVAEGIRSHGFSAGPVVVLGHSSGAHLAALAVLAVGDYSPSCDSPVVPPDALIGLSGPYDISRIPDVASSLLGTSPSDDPDSWSEANPVERADLRPEIPVLLLHGDADEIVPVAFTSQFAEALQGAGHAVTVEIVPDADHQTIYQPDVVVDRIATWVHSLEE